MPAVSKLAQVGALDSAECGFGELRFEVQCRDETRLPMEGEDACSFCELRGQPPLGKLLPQMAEFRRGCQGVQRHIQ